MLGFIDVVSPDFRQSANALQSNRIINSKHLLINRTLNASIYFYVKSRLVESTNASFDFRSFLLSSHDVQQKLHMVLSEH